MQILRSLGFTALLTMAAASALASDVKEDTTLHQQMLVMSKKSMDQGLVRRVADVGGASRVQDPYKLGSKAVEQATKVSYTGKMALVASATLDPQPLKTAADGCAVTMAQVGQNCFSHAGTSGCKTSVFGCTSAAAGCDITAQKDCYDNTFYPACQTSANCNTSAAVNCTNIASCYTAASGENQCTAVAYNCTQHSIFCHTAATGQTECFWTSATGDCGTIATPPAAACTQSSSCQQHTVAPACNATTSATIEAGCLFTASGSKLCSTVGGTNGNLCEPWTSSSSQDVSRCTSASLCDKSFAGSNCQASWAFSCLNTSAGGQDCTKVGGCLATYSMYCYTAANVSGQCKTMVAQQQCAPATAEPEVPDDGEKLHLMLLVACVGVLGSLQAVCGRQ